MAPAPGQRYKIKLATGRILGPIDLDRVRLLIKKNQITGTETAREHPDGEWTDINSIRELGELFIEKIAGQTSHESTPQRTDPQFQPAVLGPTHILTAAQAATQNPTIPSLQKVTETAPVSPLETAAVEAKKEEALALEGSDPSMEARPPSQLDENDRTVLNPRYSERKAWTSVGIVGAGDDTGAVAGYDDEAIQKVELQERQSAEDRSVQLVVRSSISTEKTVIFQRTR